MRPPHILDTQRLHLRPPVLEDAEAIFRQYAQDSEVTRYLTWKPHPNVETTIRFLNRRMDYWSQETAFTWVIVHKADQQLIGVVELRIDEPRADLGYGLGRSYWGQGLATEAVQAVVDWVLDQPKLYRVWAVCDVENAASARVLEKVGMRREGILRRWLVHPNVSAEPRDCYCYARVR